MKMSGFQVRLGLASAVLIGTLAVGSAVYSAHFMFKGVYPAHVPEEMALEPVADASEIPAISEDQYLEALRKNPRGLALVDVRWYGMFPSGNNNRFANSLGNFKSTDEVTSYLADHQRELQDKKIVFVCYGGNKARIFEQRVQNGLRKEGVRLDLAGFRKRHMLYDQPDWQIERVRYVPETMTDTWASEGSVSIVKVDVPAEPTPEFWNHTREALSGPGRIVVRTDHDPRDLEQAIYPLESRRLYETRDWKTPPRWFGLSAHALSSSVGYWTALLGVSAAMVAGLVALRRHEVLAEGSTFVWLGPVLRWALAFGLLVFVYYFTFCFIENYFFFKVPRYDGNSYFLATLAFLTIAYRRKAGALALRARLHDRPEGLSEEECSLPPKSRLSGYKLAALLGLSVFLILQQVGSDYSPWAFYGALLLGLLLIHTTYRVLWSERARTSYGLRRLWRSLKGSGRTLRAFAAQFSWLRGFIALPLVLKVVRNVSMAVYEPHQTFTAAGYVCFCFFLVHEIVTDRLLHRVSGLRPIQFGPWRRMSSPVASLAT